jgi:hypothetical protein
MAVVIEIEMCNHWMVHCRLYISTTNSNYKISAKGHYVKLLRRKLYDKREGSISHRELSIYMQDYASSLTSSKLQEKFKDTKRGQKSYIEERQTIQLPRVKEKQ